MLQPFKGAMTAHFYTLEDAPGVTPKRPEWIPLRNTGGVPAVTKDQLISNELDGSREVSAVRTGSVQVAGEYAIELSSSSQDELLAGAMSAAWRKGQQHEGLTISVSETRKTFRSLDGDFVGVSVGDLISFPDLSDGNAKPFIVTKVSSDELEGAGIAYQLTEETATTKLRTADALYTGGICKTYSVLTWFQGVCGARDGFLLTKGVEFSGFSIELAVNAMVTGSFPFIGLSQEVLTKLPEGSTFNNSFNTTPFASVDVSAYRGDLTLELIDTFTITNDNATSAQFALGNKGVAFVERGRASNTFSLAGKLADTDLLKLFVSESWTNVAVSALLSNTDGAMAFTLNNTALTAATPEIGGPESVTVSIEGQATGGPYESSLVIQRLLY